MKRVMTVKIDGIIANGPRMGAWPKYEKNSGFEVMLYAKRVIARITSANVKFDLKVNRFSRYCANSTIKSRELSTARKICTFRINGSCAGL